MTIGRQAELRGTSTTVAGTDRANPVSRLGLRPGVVVQEFGYDDDVDFDLRTQIERATGTPLADEDYDDTCDAALLWWRDDDGDLTDMLVDVTSALEDGGVILVLTPKAGMDGHVTPADIDEAATTAGMHATSAIAVASGWAGTRLAARSRGK